jgi:hypothetical protein
MEDKKEVNPPKLIKIKNGDPCFSRKDFEDWLRSKPKGVKWEPLADRQMKEKKTKTLITMFEPTEV